MPVLAGCHACGIPMKYLLIASVTVHAGSILVLRRILPGSETANSITDVKTDNKGNNFNGIGAIAEGAATGIRMR